MLSTSDLITVVSSLVLRFSIYVFLRWIPTTIVPPLIIPLVLIYITSFFISVQDTAHYKVLSDEIDIIVKETVAQGDSSSDEAELLDGAEDGPLEELDVQETIQYEENEPKILQTLLTGLPSPSSAFLSWITFGINMALVVMALDLMFRAPLLHKSHDLSFGRVGYVSDTSAQILIREPGTTESRILYRPIDSPRWLSRSATTGEPHTWLSNDTDFTTSIKLDHLTPDTSYVYTIQTSTRNQTGRFLTAPRVGHISPRNNDKYTFVHSSCIKPRVPYTLSQHPLHIPGFAHLATWIHQLRPYFMLFLGDFIYVDVPQQMGKDSETYRSEYRQVYASPDWPSVSEDLPWIHVIDDHEIANDWDKNTTGVYKSAYDPFTHYHASVNPPPVRKGETYFSFTQGPAQFFLMDTRRYRSPETSNATDQNKSMLGATQLADLVAWLRKPPPRGVRWKIVVSSIPFTKNWRFGFQDTWAGYLFERQKILEAMWDVGADGGVGVVVLSGDRHEFAATSFPPPKEGRWPVSATVYEFSTSPLSMFYLPWRTYSEIDEGDVCIKYLPDGNSKFGAVELTSPASSEQSHLNYRLFVDGREAWSFMISTPPVRTGTGIQRVMDVIWGRGGRAGEEGGE
ncbi:Metallo-dependent phosphatase [Lepidopterella palustris CBS 459.81]|uniref:Metallo-dependent phosphatase n=1 Tax=Lepidopterella palustris CBS 459.81 TaxID=1314670 RepID=A0A8E2EG15_9PEZI|nr:Metallo-dependent phosphatase [Lepidopterella palustris CBS 459.81]